MLFNDTANKVLRTRMNYNAPECMKALDSVQPTDLKDKTITIDKVVVSTRVKKDKETKEIIKNKDGQEIYQPIVFVAFDKTKFFATRSAILVEQIQVITGKVFDKYKKADYEISELNGKKVLISAEKVKYRDGKSYDNMIFKDA